MKSIRSLPSAPYQELHILKQVVDSIDENLNKKNRPLQGGIKQTYVELLFFASELFDQLIQSGLDVAALAKQG